MKLTHICIITKSVRKLTDFYKKILQISPSIDMDEYAEFELGGAKLAIFDSEMHGTVASNSLIPESNKSVIIEIAVDDVDKEYERLCKENVTIVRKPGDQVWGVRSFYFKDCDGNLVDFYTHLENQDL
ncbi:MAG: VOC family protein [Oscillospiraceae bacterium]|jgi:predicted enzyme related to lactoylglutathione lyase|nr:VOC family protein [Oscillospiraceae bacterium]